jgi:hypothetical protein
LMAAEKADRHPDAVRLRPRVCHGRLRPYILVAAAPVVDHRVSVSEKLQLHLPLSGFRDS